MFIHNALDELITCGDTEIVAANMRIAIGRLSRTVPGQAITGFQAQEVGVEWVWQIFVSLHLC